MLRLLCVFGLVVGMAAEAKTKKQIKVVTIAHAANFSSESLTALNPLNSAYSDAARMAIGEFEKAFERLGYEIRVLNLHHGPKDSDAPKTAEDAVKSDAVAILGYYQSGKALLAVPILVKGGLALVSPTSSAVKLNEFGPLVRTLSISNRQMAEQMVKVAKEKYSPKKVLLVTESDCAYCLDLEAELKTALTHDSIQFVNTTIGSQETNFESVLKVALSDRFDVILVPNQELSTSRLAQYLLTAGVKLPYVGGDGWGNGGSEGFFEVMKDPNFEAYTIGHWSPEKGNKHGKIFAKQWLNRFYREPTNDWAMVYEGTHFILQVLLDMAKDRVPITRENVAKKIASVKDYKGMVSRFVFEGPGSPPKRNIVILKANPKKKRFDPTELVWVE